MKSEESKRSLELYLTSLDDQLLARGVDPKIRLGHVEQVADTVLAANSTAESEFGSAETYAAELVESLGISGRSGWLRSLAVGLGFILVFEGIGALTQATTIGGLDEPFEWSFAIPIFLALWMGFAAYITLAPAGVRLVTARLNRLKQWQMVALAAPLMIGGMAATASLSPNSVELLSRGAMIPIAVGATILGLAMSWWSGYWQLVFATMTQQTRRGSSMKYNLFGAPRITLADYSSASASRPTSLASPTQPRNSVHVPKVAGD